MSSAPTLFDPAIVTAVLHHMNDDHADDNLLIARAFGDRAAQRAHMTHVDGLAGYWAYSNVVQPESTDPGASATELQVRVEWSAPITERAEIRREIVTLYDRACVELGLTPRPHE